MTSNQLAAEQNRINQYNADINAKNAATNEYAAHENAEHLKRMDDINARNVAETERHNNQLELLEQRKVEINEQLKDIEAQYKADQIRISEMSVRNDQDRVAVEAYKADIDAVYKGNLNRLSEESNAIEQSKAEEIERHNKEVEDLNALLNSIKATEVKYDYETKKLNIDLAMKRLDYERHQWDTENTINMLRVGNESTRISNDFYLGTANVRLRLFENQFNMNKFGLEAKVLSSEAFRNYADAITKAANAVLAAGKLF